MCLSNLEGKCNLFERVQGYFMKNLAFPYLAPKQDVQTLLKKKLTSPVVHFQATG